MIDNISLIIHSDDRIALVGENGSGKSTLVKLICGFIPPDEGNITINGIDVTKISDESRKKMLAVSFQNIISYPFEVRKNITISNLDNEKDDEKIFQILKFMDCMDIEKDLEKQVIKFEEGDTGFSNGQLQCILLARTLFSPAQFLILDEPTSSIDPIKESEIYDNYIKILQDRGCMIISHRMASARLVKKIYVLKNGKIVETGSHDSLLKDNGIYAEMYRNQEKWFH